MGKMGKMGNVQWEKPAIKLITLPFIHLLWIFLTNYFSKTLPFEEVHLVDGPP